MCTGLSESMKEFTIEYNTVMSLLIQCSNETWRDKADRMILREEKRKREERREWKEGRMK